MSSGVDHAGLAATANHQLDTQLARLREAGVAADGEAVERDARSILAGAAPIADAIVVGQRGHDGACPAHVGSVSRHLATHSEVPTIVVPEESATAPATRIAVGFDGSDESRAALRWALRITTEDAEIQVVRAFEVMNWLSPAATLERFQPEIDDAKAAFEADVAELDPDGRTTLRFEVGDAREILDATSAEVELLVLGSRGAGRLASAILGTVTSHLLHHARTPIAVVPS